MWSRVESSSLLNRIVPALDQTNKLPSGPVLTSNLPLAASFLCCANLNLALNVPAAASTTKISLA